MTGPTLSDLATAAPHQILGRTHDLTGRAEIRIGDRTIGPEDPVYIVAELSANHNQSYDEAVRLIHVAKEAGADAVKLQTYTADTITLDSQAPPFQVRGGTLWDGQTLHGLYKQAFTPWEWQPRLKDEADDIGIDLFSSPFDPTAVDFLEEMGVPAYKVASFELVDLPLIEVMAQTGKPLIMSTGMATLGEIEEAVHAARDAGAKEIALLTCTSAYPAPPEHARLARIPHLAETFGVPTGLSDHTMGIEVPVAAAALGARIIEKHYTLSRATLGPDSAFSLEPQELRAMIDAVRTAEQAIGRLDYQPSKSEQAARRLRRSLFVVRDARAGETLTSDMVRSIRPADGLPPKHLADVLGRRLKQDVERGTPLSWTHIGEVEQ